MTVVLLAGLQGISKDYYEAASIDGANAWQRFCYVTLPQLKNVSVVTLTLVTIWTFNNFDNIYMLTKGGPAQSTEVLPILTYNNAFPRKYQLCVCHGYYYVDYHVTCKLGVL